MTGSCAVREPEVASTKVISKVPGLLMPKRVYLFIWFILLAITLRATPLPDAIRSPVRLLCSALYEKSFSCTRDIRLFLSRSWSGRRFRALAHHALDIPSIVVGSSPAPLAWRSAHRHRADRAAGVFHPICCSWPRNAGTRDANGSSGRQRPVSVRSQSHVRCRICNRARPGRALRQRCDGRLCSMHMDCVYALCPPLRGADAAAEVRCAVRDLLPSRAPLDPAPHTVARRMRQQISQSLLRLPPRSPSS